MGKVYVPEIDTLYEMQNMGANVYKYLLVKEIEAIIFNGLNKKDGHILEGVYKYLREDPVISRSICSLYPREIPSSSVAKNDIFLCLALLEDERRKISPLDNLAFFDDDVLGNSRVTARTIILLEKELKENPRYLFEYKESTLLNKILSGKIEDRDLMLIFKGKREVVSALVNIEPSYGVSLPDSYFDDQTFFDGTCSRDILLKTGINNYASRYKIDDPLIGLEYRGKDILTKPDAKVKRLMKNIYK